MPEPLILYPLSMSDILHIRPVAAADIPALKDILNTLEIFPSYMLDAIIDPYLNQPESCDFWFVAIENNTPVALSYCAPEKLAIGTYNLYALGVRADGQSRGTGAAMMTFVENHLRSLGQRLLIVETSGTDAYQQSRAFYARLGYVQEAVIRDFWRDGDDKVVYAKRLQQLVSPTESSVAELN